MNTNDALFRCSPKAWDEKLAKEAANPRLSISLAIGNLERDENVKKEELAEDKEENDINDQLLSVY